MGIGGKAKVLGKVEMPSGMGGVNGTVKFSVVDSPGVPPLTPVSLLKQVGAVIDLNSNTMDLKKIETTTTLRVLPSGHVVHKLTEFAPGGWKAPTLEQMEVFQVRTDVFRPVTLPGEFKRRSSEQCAGFSNGFVYTVRDRSPLSPSHHQHDPDLCVDDAMSSDLLSDDQLAQGTSGFECLFASRFEVDANSAIGILCAGRRGSVAKSAVPGSRHPSVVAGRTGLVATNVLKNRSDRVHSFAGTPGSSRQPVGLDGCVRQDTWGMRRHHELFPLSCIDRSQRGKGQDERKEERGYHDQPESRTDCRGCSYQGERGRRMSEVRPRTSGLQHRFGTDSTLPWMESRRNTVYIDPSVPQRGCRPWRLQSTNRTGDGGSTSGSGGPGTLPRRDDGTQDSPPFNDWTSQVPALAANPAWAQEQFAQWQLLHQQCQHLQYQQQLVTVSTTDPWRVLPEDGESAGDRWSMDTGTESESMNHQQDWCDNAQSNDRKKDEPVLRASQVLGLGFNV